MRTLLLSFVVVLAGVVACARASAWDVGRYTVPDSPPGQWAAGKFERERLLHTTHGAVEVPTAHFLPDAVLPPAWSLEVWFRLFDVPTNRTVAIVSQHTTPRADDGSAGDDRDNVFYLGVRNASLVFQISGNELTSGVRRIEPAQWYHVVVSVQNTTLNPNFETKLVGVWVNGGIWVRDSFDAPRQFSTQPIVLGAYTNSTHSESNDGLIDEFRLWASVRNMTEVEYSAGHVAQPEDSYEWRTLLFAATFESPDTLRVRDDAEMRSSPADGSYDGSAQPFSLAALPTYLRGGCEELPVRSCAASIAGSTVSARTNLTVDSTLVACNITSPTDANDTQTFYTGSNAVGDWLIDELPAQTYDCQCEAAGYASSAIDDNGFNRVRLHECQDFSGVECRMDPLPLRITVRVSDCADAATPISGAQVFCVVNDVLGQIRLPQNGFGRTNTQGRVVFGNIVGRGRVVCEVNAAAQGFGYGAAQGNLTVEDTSMEVCALSTGFTVRAVDCATENDPNPLPVVNATVEFTEVVQSGQARRVSSQTDADGFANLPTGVGIFDLEISRDPFYEPAADTGLQAIEGEFRIIQRCMVAIDQPASIIGRVTDGTNNDQPRSDAEVSCTRSDGFSDNTLVPTNATGYYEIRGIFDYGPVVCNASVDAEELWKQEQSTVVEGQTTVINFSLESRPDIFARRDEEAADLYLIEVSDRIDRAEAAAAAAARRAHVPSAPSVERMRAEIDADHAAHVAPHQAFLRVFGRVVAPVHGDGVPGAECVLHRVPVDGDVDAAAASVFDERAESRTTAKKSQAAAMYVTADAEGRVGSAQEPAWLVAHETDGSDAAMLNELVVSCRDVHLFRNDGITSSRVVPYIAPLGDDVRATRTRLHADEDRQAELRLPFSSLHNPSAVPVHDFWRAAVDSRRAQEQWQLAQQHHMSAIGRSFRKQYQDRFQNSLKRARKHKRALAMLSTVDNEKQQA